MCSEYACGLANATTCWSAGGMSQDGYRDGLALLRVLLSCLSVLGAASIVGSAVARKQMFSSEVHPILMLSLADCLLALSWVAGGVLWFRHPYQERVWCFMASLCTIILECITVNLTMVYACQAYSTTKQQSSNTEDKPRVLQHPVIASTVYCIAWILPMILVLVPFGIIVKYYKILPMAKCCSCWCTPTFGNVLPLASLEGEGAERLDYIFNIQHLILMYGVVLLIHYSIGFITLIVVYAKTFKQLKRERENTYTLLNSIGSIERKNAKYSKAQLRVISYLTIFIISGFFNFVLALTVMVHKVRRLRAGLPDDYISGNGSWAELDKWVELDWNDSKSAGMIDNWIYYLQSLTTPLQGLLNAVVYGWTRKDFVQALDRELVADSMDTALGERTTLRRRQAEAEEEGQGSWKESTCSYGDNDLTPIPNHHHAPSPARLRTNDPN